MRREAHVILIALLVGLIVTSSWAGQTGKLSGTVVDTDTGEPLPFADVIVGGTTMGASTDEKGRYFILNVAPGTYSVSGSYYGYRTVTKTEVLVKTDQNRIINFSLGLKTIEKDEFAIEVVAERPIIEMDVTGSVQTVTAEKIKQLPVNNVNEILDASAGVVSTGGQLHFRGGRSNEALYMVDGMSIKDPISGAGSGLEVGKGAIEEVSVLTGGFDAEYGEAQSAIINIVTKEGTPEYHGSVRYKTDKLGISALDKYSFNSDYAEFSLSGPEPITSYLLPSIGLRLPGQKLSFIFSATGDISDTYTPYPNRPDVSHNFLGLELNERLSNKFSLTSKIIYSPRPMDKFKFNYLKSVTRSQPFYQDYYYIPEHGHWQSERKSEQMVMTWNHTFSSKTFMELNAGRFETSLYSNAGINPDQLPLEPDAADPSTLPWEESQFYNWYYEYINADYPEAWADGDVLVDGSEPWDDFGQDGKPGTYDEGEGDGIANDWDEATGPSKSSWNPYSKTGKGGYYDYGYDGVPGTGDKCNKWIFLGESGEWEALPVEGYLTLSSFIGEGDGSFNTFNSYPELRLYVCEFYDVNGNGYYDIAERDAGLGEWFTDRNSNGRFDAPNWSYEDGEEYVDYTGDGDWTYIDNFYDGSVPEEEFTDVNGNGVFDAGESFVDANDNGLFDSGEPYFDYGLDGIPDTGDYGEGNYAFDSHPYDASVHEPYVDLNGNGNYDAGEEFQDGEEFAEDSFTDVNYDGVYSPESEDWTDSNDNGIFDLGEDFIDGPNGFYDIGEPFQDVGEDGIPNTKDPGESDGIRNYDEPYYDYNGNGVYDYDVADEYWDVGIDGIPGTHDKGEGNGKYDAGEPFNDLIGDGQWDNSDSFVDRNGNGYYDGGEPFEDCGPDGSYNTYDPGQYNGYYDLGEPFQDVGPDGIAGTGDIGENNGVYDGSLENGIWNDGEPYYDENGDGIYNTPNGKWDNDEPFVDANFNGSWDERYDGAYSQWIPWSYHKDVIYSFKAKVESQIHEAHEIKTGLEIKFHDLEQWEIQYPYWRYTPGSGSGEATGPWPDRGVFRNFWSAQPIEGAVYAQDKFEYEDMIMKIGLRYDFWYLGDLETSKDTLFYQDIYGDEWESKLNKKVETKLSPRFAISYPISQYDKMYFSYGHFSQMPDLELIYNANEQGASAITLKGNLALESPRTTEYEFGVEHAFSDDVKIDVKGFFKDFRGLIQATKVKRSTGSEDYVYLNNDYGNARGFELNLDKRYSNYTSGSISYTYQFAQGKNSSDRESYPQGEDSPEEFPLDWDQRHSLTINFDFRVFEDQHPKIGKLALPDKWGMNILWQLGSGLPFTPEYSGKAEGSKNSERYPWTSSVDVILNKDYNWMGLEYALTMEVSNLLDTDNVNSIDSWYRTPEGDQTPYSLNPANYLEGRQFELGLEVRF